jgi:flagellar motility protein MotE (MotC chaperone)
VYPTFGSLKEHIKFKTMAKAGKTVATLIVGAAIGAALGYILATDKDKRQEDLANLKDKFSDLKDKLSKKSKELEEDIFNA